ncbi:hypothetical protein K3495_g7053 [Podosphaera aphanis]|nr:hypothetical protein K3495_g7053 [Podosphaera aphanis]
MLACQSPLFARSVIKISAPSKVIKNCELKGTPEEMKKQLAEYTRHVRHTLETPNKSMPKAQVKHSLDAVLEVLSSDKAIEHAARVTIAHIKQKPAVATTYAGVASSQGPSLTPQTAKSSKWIWK